MSGTAMDNHTCFGDQNPQASKDDAEAGLRRSHSPASLPSVSRRAAAASPRCARFLSARTEFTPVPRWLIYLAMAWLVFQIEGWLVASFESHLNTLWWGMIIETQP